MRRLARKIGSWQSARFILVGVAQLALDSGLFVALTWAGLAPSIANPISRCIVVIIGFWMHGSYTFAESGVPKLGRGYMARFFPAWIVLTLIGTLVLASVKSHAGLHAAWIAKPLVDGVLAVISYLTLRRWVFRSAA